MVAKVMVAAAEQHEDIAPAYWEADVVRVERRSVEVAVDRGRAAAEFPYRPGQSVAVEIPQRPRLWRYFSPANAPHSSGRLQFHVQPIAGGLVSTAAVRRLSQGDTIRTGRPGRRAAHPARERMGSRSSHGRGRYGPGAAARRIGADRPRLGGQGSGPRVHLFHGSKMPWNLYDHEYLARLATKPWLTYTPVVSEDHTYPGCRGLVGSGGSQGRRLVATHSHGLRLAGYGPAHGAGAQGCGFPAGSIRREQFDFSGSASPTQELQDAWETR